MLNQRRSVHNELKICYTCRGLLVIARAPSASSTELASTLKGSSPSSRHDLRSGRSSFIGHPLLVPTELRFHGYSTELVRYPMHISPAKLNSIFTFEPGRAKFRSIVRDENCTTGLVRGILHALMMSAFRRWKNTTSANSRFARAIDSALDSTTGLPSRPTVSTVAYRTLA